jgi:hypothetical protein
MHAANSKRRLRIVRAGLTELSAKIRRWHCWNIAAFALDNCNINAVRRSVIIPDTEYEIRLLYQAPKRVSVVRRWCKVLPARLGKAGELFKLFARHIRPRVIMPVMGALAIRKRAAGRSLAMADAVLKEG